MQITCGKSDIVHILPMEIAAWWMRKLSVKAKDFILVVSPDSRAALASHTIVRFPLAINVMAGNSSMEALQVSLPTLVSLVLSVPTR